MSPALSLMLIAASVLVVAVVWIAVTRRSKVASKPPPEPIVVWMRARDHQLAHAFRTAELRAELPDVQALAFCGRWPVAALVPVTELVRDDDAPRCAACERAVEALEDRE